VISKPRGSSRAKKRSATVEVVENPRKNNSGKSGVDWRDNEFISD
jgi:hypothetical protein